MSLSIFSAVVHSFCVHIFVWQSRDSFSTNIILNKITIHWCYKICHLSKLCNPSLDCTRYNYIIARVARKFTRYGQTHVFFLEVFSFRFVSHNCCEERNQSEPLHDMYSQPCYNNNCVLVMLFCYFVHSFRPIIITCRKNGYSLFVHTRISYKMSNFLLLLSVQD